MRSPIRNTWKDKFDCRWSSHLMIGQLRHQMIRSWTFFTLLFKPRLTHRISSTLRPTVKVSTNSSRRPVVLLCSIHRALHPCIRWGSVVYWNELQYTSLKLELECTGVFLVGREYSTLSRSNSICICHGALSVSLPFDCALQPVRYDDPPKLLMLMASRSSVTGPLEAARDAFRTEECMTSKECYVRNAVDLRWFPRPFLWVDAK